MKTHVEFRSDKFPAYPGEEDEVNPGLWGKRLAEYLHQKLKEQGMETEKKCRRLGLDCARMVRLSVGILPRISSP